jgi:hypothetical protein
MGTFLGKMKTLTTKKLKKLTNRYKAITDKLTELETPWQATEDIGSCFVLYGLSIFLVPWPLRA